MQLKPLPLPSSQYSDATGMPTQVFYQYMSGIDQFVRALTGGNSTLTNAANDAAAAAAGVPIGQFYRNGNAVQVRLV